MTNPAKTRILYIAPVPPHVGGKSPGGIATHAWELATQAYKRGYEVYILTNTTSSFIRDHIHIISPQPRSNLLKALLGLKFYLTSDKSKISCFDFLSLKEKIIVSYGAYFLKKILDSVKPALIHVHSLAGMATLSLSILPNQAPILVTDHGIGVVYSYDTLEIYGFKNRNYLTKKLREISKRATYIISVSEFAKKHLLMAFDFFDDQRIKTIPNPLDVTKLPLLNKQEIKEELGLKDKKVLFFSGVHEPLKKKRLDILLRAFDTNEYLRRNCALLIVTTGQAITFAQHFVKEKNIDAVVLGPQPWENLVKYYNSADIFVLPSTTEGIGLVYEEALFAGVPVVGFPESIGELEHLFGIYIGEKFDARNEEEKDLAEKIIKVLHTDFDRELIRRKVIENLSWDAKFGDFDSIYKELL